jgi:hypothetical protein
MGTSQGDEVATPTLLRHHIRQAVKLLPLLIIALGVWLFWARIGGVFLCGGVLIAFIYDYLYTYHKIALQVVI